MKTYFEWGGLAIGFIPVFHVKIGYKSGRNDVMKAYDLHVSNREIRWKKADSDMYRIQCFEQIESVQVIRTTYRLKIVDKEKIELT